VKAPDDCKNMSELRNEIDALDEKLVALLALRETYIDRAIILKPKEGIPPQAPDRVAAVLSKVEGLAEMQGLSKDLAVKLWKVMIDYFIEKEDRAFGNK